MNTRNQNEDDFQEVLNPPLSKQAARMRRYRSKVRLDAPRYETAKAKDRERKREERSQKRQELLRDRRQLQVEREKKRVAQQKYRERLKEKKLEKYRSQKKKTHTEKQLEKYKKEKRKVSVLRAQKWRMRICLSGGAKGQQSKSSPFPSRWSEYRQVKKVKEALPATPTKKAHVLAKLTRSPRTHQILVEKGLSLSETVKKKLDMSDAIIDSLHTSLAESSKALTPDRPQNEKKNIRNATETIYQSAIRGISRKYRIKDQLRNLLHIRYRRGRKDWWNPKKRKARKDRLPRETVEKVEDWFLSSVIAKEVPCKRQVYKKKDASGEVSVTPRYVMTMTMQEAYKRFQQGHPEESIGFTAFKQLKPKQVSRVSHTSRRTCLCQTCCNMSLMLEALMKGPKSDKLLSIKCKKDLADLTLCPYDEKPMVMCLHHVCDKCSAKKLSSILAEDLIKYKDEEVSFHRWEYVAVPVKEGEKNKRVLSCVVKKIPFPKLIQQCEADLQFYPRHHFEAEWQQHQLTLCTESYVGKTNVMAVMDFAENYRVSYQNEVQTAFFDPVQVTIYPMMYYYKDKNNKVVKHAIIGISNDVKHDATLAKQFQTAAIDIIQENGVKITSIHEWTDGCAAQFKGKHAFHDLSMAPIQTTRNFFVTSHGKNVCDGLGAVVKNMAYRYVLGHNIISGAYDLFEYCKSSVAHPSKEIVKEGKQSYISQRDFVFVDFKEVGHDRHDVKTLSGTRKLHVVQNMGMPLSIKTRNLSCYCQPCLQGHPDHCRNKEYVEPWMHQFIKVTKAKSAKGSILLPLWYSSYTLIILRDYEIMFNFIMII